MPTGDQILATCLVRQNVKTIFGAPGKCNLSALEDHPKIQMISTQNGSDSTLMACAHGQLTGHPGICCIDEGEALGTARQFNAQPIVIIANTGSAKIADRRGNSGFANPNYATVAASGKTYGFRTEKIDSHDDLNVAFSRAVSPSGGALIELMVDPEYFTPNPELNRHPRTK